MYKDLAFTIVIGPITVFPLEHIAVNHSYNNAVHFGSFNTCSLELILTLSHDVMDDHNWTFGFSVSQIVDNPVVCSHKCSSALTTFKPPNYFKFLRNH